jgi:lysozyme family protein
MAEKWIQKAVGKNPGKLHRALGVAADKKIPAKKLAAGAKSKSPTVRKEVALARTLKSFHRG